MYNNNNKKVTEIPVGGCPCVSHLINNIRES